MIAKYGSKILAVVLSIVLVTSSPQILYGFQTQNSTPSYGSGGATDAAPMSASELDSLVAPIALYPDALVAQILSAATFPDQIAVANYWLQQNKDLTGQALLKAVNQESWDPSVKALTQFPSVLDNMAKNLSWVSSLGEAYHNQAPKVMSAVQKLRAEAKAAGNLKSGDQIKVVQQSPQTIVIEPANPQVVYVPQYNPATIYGTTYVTPGYTAGDVAAAGIIGFGAGIAIGALMSGGGGCCAWGWSNWSCNWYGGAAYYGYHPYYGNASWHGGYYGAGGSAYGPYGSAHYGQGYNPATGTYARGASVATPYGSQKVGQAYNPRTGAYGATHQGSNGYSNWGSSVVSKNGESAYTQHYSNARGSAGTVQTSYGGKAAATSSAYGNSAVGKTANGNEYAAHNGNAYKNTGSGWEKSGGGDSTAFHGSADRSGGSGGGGWGARTDSSRGWSSMRSSGFGGGRFGGGGSSGGGFHGGGGFRR